MNRHLALLREEARLLGQLFDDAPGFMACCAARSTCSSGLDDLETALAGRGPAGR